MALFIEGREFNDYKEFVTEIGDLEKETSLKLINIKKGAKTIEAENRKLSTDNIQYNASLYMRVWGLTASMLESQGGRGKGFAASEVSLMREYTDTTHNRHIILY